MRTSTLFTVGMLLVSVSWGHVINRREPSKAMLRNLNEITKHFEGLTAAMGEFDSELRQALSVDTKSRRDIKRSTNGDEDSSSCRVSLNADICQALEIFTDRFSPNLTALKDPYMPGKRSEEDKYQKIASDLQKKRQLLHKLRSVLNNAGNILEREKKWFTCNLNLGFTCQTQEYAAIADYYDFLNSSDSPGKKRSAPSRARNS